MKPLFWIVASTLLTAFITLPTGALAASSQNGRQMPSMRQMEACFRAHGKLMSKPAVMNIYDCWRAHGYLMDR